MLALSGRALVMDIGGSHVSAAVVDLAARELMPRTRRRAYADASGSAGSILDTWAFVALDTLAPQSPADIAAIGIAMPGPFDYAAGVSLMRHKYQALYHVDVIAELRGRWQGTALAAATVRVANDADLFALGEWWAGAARGCDAAIGLTLGTGLGSGFIRGGRIVSSGPGVPADGDLWNAPYLDGIAEDYACGAAIRRSYARGGRPQLPVEEIARRAEAGDQAALDAFGQLAGHLAGILAARVAQFQPDCLVVGGNIARSWPLFGPRLQADLAPLACRPSALFEDAALLGAAAI